MQNFALNVETTYKKRSAITVAVKILPHQNIACTVGIFCMIL